MLANVDCSGGLSDWNRRIFSIGDLAPLQGDEGQGVICIPIACVFDSSRREKGWSRVNQLFPPDAEVQSIQSRRWRRDLADRVVRGMAVEEQGSSGVDDA